MLHQPPPIAKSKAQQHKSPLLFFSLCVKAPFSKAVISPLPNPVKAEECDLGKKERRTLPLQTHNYFTLLNTRDSGGGGRQKKRGAEVEDEAISILFSTVIKSSCLLLFFLPPPRSRVAKKEKEILRHDFKLFLYPPPSPPSIPRKAEKMKV